MKSNNNLIIKNSDAAEFTQEEMLEYIYSDLSKEEIEIISLLDDNSIDFGVAKKAPKALKSNVMRKIVKDKSSYATKPIQSSIALKIYTSLMLLFTVLASFTSSIKSISFLNNYNLKSYSTFLERPWSYTSTFLNSLTETLTKHSYHYTIMLIGVIAVLLIDAFYNRIISRVN